MGSLISGKSALCVTYWLTNWPYPHKIALRAAKTDKFVVNVVRSLTQSEGWGVLCRRKPEKRGAQKRMEKEKGGLGTGNAADGREATQSTKSNSK